MVWKSISPFPKEARGNILCRAISAISDPPSKKEGGLPYGIMYIN